MRLHFFYVRFSMIENNNPHWVLVLLFTLLHDVTIACAKTERLGCRKIKNRNYKVVATLKEIIEQTTLFKNSEQLRWLFYIKNN